MPEEEQGAPWRLGRTLYRARAVLDQTSGARYSATLDGPVGPLDADVGRGGGRGAVLGAGLERDRGGGGEHLGARHATYARDAHARTQRA